MFHFAYSQNKFLGGRGILKVKILEVKYEAKLIFPGKTGGEKQKTFHGGSMDAFWNYTVITRASRKRGVNYIVCAMKGNVMEYFKPGE